MAELKDKVITVESLKAKHDYDEDTYLKKNGGEMTGNITLSGGADIVASNKDFYFSHASSDTTHCSVLLGGDSYDNGASIYLNGKDYTSDKGRFLLRAANGTDSVNLIGLPDGTLTWGDKDVAVEGDYLPISGGTITGNFAIKKSSPTMMLKVGDTSLETRLYKNASDTTDYGTMLADYDSSGKRDALTLRRSANLAEKLSISVNNSSGGNDIYYVYGEHHKPTPSEIGAAAAPQAITAHMNVEYYVLPSGNTYCMLPLSNAIYVGDAITMTNNRIKIGADISKVRISAQVCVGSSNRTNKFLAIRKNGSGQIARAQMKLTENTTAETMAIAPVIVNVSEGDLITLDFQGEASDTIYGGLNLTYITVEKMA